MTAVPASRTPSFPRTPPRRAAVPAPVPSRFAYWALVVYLILEIARPPVVTNLRLQLLFVIVLPLLWLRAQDRPWSSILTAQVSLLLLSALAVPFARNNYAAYFTTRTLFATVALAIVLSWVFSSRAGLRRFYWCWLLLMSYVALYGITHGGNGPGGFLGDENDMALGCVSAFPFAYYGLERLSGWKRWLAAGCGMVLAGAVVVSWSRGGFVGLVAALGYCFLTSQHKLRNLLIALAASVVFVVVTPSSFWKEMATIEDMDQGTAQSRQFLWLTAFNIWRANPVLGAGGGNFPFIAGKYQPHGGRWDEPRYAERDWSGTVTHSTYFQLLSEMGLAGIVSFGWIVGAHFRGLRRVRVKLRLERDAPGEVARDAELLAGSLAGGMLATLAAGAFLSAGYYPYFYYLSAAGVGVVHAFSRERAERASGGRGMPAKGGKVPAALA